MIPNPSGDVSHFDSGVSPSEAVWIVQNFQKGLTEIRAALGPAPRPPIVQIRIPKLALLPPPSSRRRVLLLSALLHGSILAAVVDLPILFPEWTVLPTVTAETTLSREANFEVLFVPVLPPVTRDNPDYAAKPKPAAADDHLGLTSPARRAAQASPSAPDYAGAQRIVSNPPHAPKGVQTIRRPDLVDPPKLAFPVALPSLTMFPAPAIPAPMAPRRTPTQPVRPNPKKPRSIPASEPTLQLQARSVAMPKLPVASQEPAMPPKVMPAYRPSSPRLAGGARPEIPAPKAVVVVDAVNIPPGPLPPIPDKELASRFVIAPPTPAPPAETASGAGNGDGEGAGTASAKEKLPEPNSKGAREGEGVRVAANGSGAGSTVKTATRSVPNDGAVAHSENAGLPGLVISGGVRGREGRADVSTPIARPSYGLTIMSGGNSGGASRDVGVFSRKDTVYTVYIPMADAGGGAPWPMEYALLGTAPVNGGLLAPPVVLKKAPVAVSVVGAIGYSGPVFLAGIIDEDGKLRDLRAVHASDPRARSAMDALAQWEFLAAQLNGKQVACKVLIGVSVLGAEGVVR